MLLIMTNLFYKRFVFIWDLLEQLLTVNLTNERRLQNNYLPVCANNRSGRYLGTEVNGGRGQ